jgi:excisionase family DNA binding protein
MENHTDIPGDLITVSEARVLLGVSRVKIAKLIRDGALKHFENRLDARVKLVSKAEVLSLQTPTQAEAA